MRNDYKSLIRYYSNVVIYVIWKDVGTIWKVGKHITDTLLDWLMNINSLGDITFTWEQLSTIILMLSKAAFIVL